MFYIRENNRNIRFLGLYAITVVKSRWSSGIVKSVVFDEEFSLVICVEYLLIVITSRVWNNAIIGIMPTGVYNHSNGSHICRTFFAFVGRFKSVCRIKVLFSC